MRRDDDMAGDGVGGGRGGWVMEGAMRSHVVAFLFGAMLGAAVPVAAQTAVKVTPSGGWNLQVDCDAQATLTIAVDGGSAVPAVVTWSGTGPYVATLPLSQMPAAARVVGPHTLVVSVPATTVQLADGSPYTYPAGSLSVAIDVLPDTPPPSNPPRNPRWLKIIGTIAAAVITGLVAWLG